MRSELYVPLGSGTAIREPFVLIWVDYSTVSIVTTNERVLLLRFHEKLGYPVPVPYQPYIGYRYRHALIPFDTVECAPPTAKGVFSKDMRSVCF